MLRLFGISPQTPDPSSAPPVKAATADDRDTVLVEAVVVNQAERSDPIPTKPQSGIPRLFVQSNYVAAVRASDGRILSRGVATQPAEVIEFYGTGFGLTTGGTSTKVDSVDANCIGNRVMVSIGSIPAAVRFVGRVGPGLYQINVIVPAELASGDHTVSVSVAGTSTTCQGLLKIAVPSDASSAPAGRYSCFTRKAMEEDAVVTGIGA